MNKLKTILCGQQGQSMVEYNFLLLLLSLAAFAALVLIGQYAPEVFRDAAGSL